MEIVYAQWATSPAYPAASDTQTHGRQIYLDHFLENAIEVDVDALCDGRRGRGSAASCSTSRRPGSTPETPPACCRRTRSGRSMLERIREQTRGIALALGVIGLIYGQFAVVPSRAGAELLRDRGEPPGVAHRPVRVEGGGVPLASSPAASCSASRSRAGAARLRLMRGGYSRVKEAVFPFSRFPGADTLLGPEMRSTGEVMGVSCGPPAAFAKSQAAAGNPLPPAGTVFVTVPDADKAPRRRARAAAPDLGFHIVATSGYRRSRSSGWACPVNDAPARSPKAHRTSSTRSPAARSTS